MSFSVTRTCHACKIREGRVHTERFVHHGIKVREIIGKLIIDWVGPELEKFRSQFGLNIRVF